jgi:diacylglycerol kinase family enzyme
VTPLQSALVVLNPFAHGGTAAARYERVRPVIEASFSAQRVTVGGDEAWLAEVRAAVGRGVRIFVAAGGDGTAHALLNALAAAPNRPPLDSIALGAVGLGSSNDLLKPVRRRVHGIPVRLDVDRAELRDVVRCIFTDGSGPREALMLVSASIGVAATANARFAEGAPGARLLRRVSTGGAIAWAAARTIARWHDVGAELRADGGPATRVALSSLSVLKTEWLSGLLRYGHPVPPASGDFDVALAEGGGRLRLLADALALLRGQFDARSLDVRLDGESPLELDGEVVSAREAHFDMFPERIRLCRG